MEEKVQAKIKTTQRDVSPTIGTTWSAMVGKEQQSVHTCDIGVCQTRAHTLGVKKGCLSVSFTIVDPIVNAAHAWWCGWAGDERPTLNVCLGKCKRTDSVLPLDFCFWLTFDIKDRKDLRKSPSAHCTTAMCFCVCVYV